MHPLLGGAVRSYGVLLATALVAAALLTLARARAAGMATGAVAWCAAAAVAGGLVGARALWVVTNLRWIGGWQDAVRFERGGLVAWGGFLGGGAAAWLAGRRLPFAAFVDAVAPGLGLAAALARVGCLLEGCDFGRPTTLAWALRFPAGSPAFNAQRVSGLLGPEAVASLPVHATQVYEAMFGVVACVALLALGRPRWLRPGGLGVLFFVGYSLLRFGLEFLRGDADRGEWLALSTSQWIAAAALLAALVGWRRWLLPRSAA